MAWLPFQQFVHLAIADYFVALLNVCSYFCWLQKKLLAVKDLFFFINKNKINCAVSPLHFFKAFLD
jgi:hypothetical protein